MSSHENEVSYETKFERAEMALEHLESLVEHEYEDREPDRSYQNIMNLIENADHGLEQAQKEYDENDDVRPETARSVVNLLTPLIQYTADKSGQKSAERESNEGRAEQKGEILHGEKRLNDEDPDENYIGDAERSDVEEDAIAYENRAHEQYIQAGELAADREQLVDARQMIQELSQRYQQHHSAPQ